MARRDDALSGTGPSYSDYSVDFCGNPNLECEFPLNLPQEASANQENLNCTSNNPNPQQQNVDWTSDSFWNFKDFPEQPNVIYMAGTSEFGYSWAYRDENYNPVPERERPDLSAFLKVVTNTRQNSGIDCSKNNDVSGSGPSTSSFANNFASASQGSHDQVSNTNNSSLNIRSFGEHPPQNSDAINYIDKRKARPRACNVKKRKKHFPHKLDDKMQYNSIEHHSTNNIESLSSESDGDEALSSDSKEMRFELPVEVSDKKHEVNCEVPKTGMVFSSEELAYKFYKNYAAEIGFSVRKGKVQRLADGTIRKRYFYCSKQGFRLKQQSDKATKFKRKETRTGCDAQMEFIAENGKWVVSNIILKHNHDLDNPSQRHMVDSRTKISETHSTHTVNEVGIPKEVGAAKCVGLRRMENNNYYTPPQESCGTSLIPMPVTPTVGASQPPSISSAFGPYGFNPPDPFVRYIDENDEVQVVRIEPFTTTSLPEGVNSIPREGAHLLFHLFEGAKHTIMSLTHKYTKKVHERDVEIERLRAILGDRRVGPSARVQTLQGRHPLDTPSVEPEGSDEDTVENSYHAQQEQRMEERHDGVTTRAQQGRGRGGRH